MSEYTLYCAIPPSTVAGVSGFVLTGEIDSDWGGSTGDSFPFSNTVIIDTGLEAHFHYDIYTPDYYTSQWVFNSHASGYVSAAHGLNPFEASGIDGNSDFNRGAQVNITTDFDAWFHGVQPDDSTHHYILTSVDYRLTTTGGIYLEGPTNQELMTPPGDVQADAVGWVTIP